MEVMVKGTTEAKRTLGPQRTLMPISYVPIQNHRQTETIKSQPYLVCLQGQLGGSFITLGQEYYFK